MKHSSGRRKREHGQSHGKKKYKRTHVHETFGEKIQAHVVKSLTGLDLDLGAVLDNLVWYAQGLAEYGAAPDVSRGLELPKQLHKLVFPGCP